MAVEASFAVKTLTSPGRHPPLEPSGKPGAVHRNLRVAGLTDSGHLATLISLNDGVVSGSEVA